jgi:hypothetical protein
MGNPTTESRPAQPDTPLPSKASAHPYEHLIKGYHKEVTGKMGGWDPRCSLDGYYYNHLPSTTLAHRDSDQVVLRYAWKWHLPVRIFMVDHLWMWILGNRESNLQGYMPSSTFSLRCISNWVCKDTIITCSALNWDSWDVTQENDGAETRNTYELNREDPMNVHHNILRHLKRPFRQPVTSVYDLACLITDFCTGLFLQQDIPDEFQFFDFFEREIARLVRPREPYLHLRILDSLPTERLCNICVGILSTHRHSTQPRGVLD